MSICPIKDLKLIIICCSFPTCLKFTLAFNIFKISRTINNPTPVPLISEDKGWSNPSDDTNCRKSLQDNGKPVPVSDTVRVILPLKDVIGSISQTTRILPSKQYLHALDIKFVNKESQISEQVKKFQSPTQCNCIFKEGDE